jgi:hypothetical protein
MAAGKLPQLDRPAVDGTEGQAQLTPSAVQNHSCSSPHEHEFHACYSLVCCGCELALNMGFFFKLLNTAQQKSRTLNLPTAYLYTVKKVIGIIKLFPSGESLINNIPGGDGKIANLFFTVYVMN